MLQCEKLLSLGLAERRDALEKSGLCMFCLKHSAELERYGKGGLSKPRCTRPGCDGEHTPGLHMLMGEDNAGVNLIAGDEDEDQTEDESEAEDEYECEEGGWWVGTIGVMEAPEETGETSCTAAGPEPVQDDDQNEVRDDSQVGWEHDLRAEECPEEEMAEDEWWELEPGYPNPEGEGTYAPQTEPPQHPLSGMARPPRPAGAGRQRLRERSRVTANQQWEEARRSAWLRQVSSDSTSDDDEDEERYGRFAESGRRMSELYGFPQRSTTTSGGECSG
jgi:hypothetical protein